MSKIVHEHVFDMQLFKKSEIGWVEKQYLQLNIKGCCMLALCLMEKKTTTHFIGEMSYYPLSENFNNVSKIVIFGQKWCFFCQKNHFF